MASSCRRSVCFLVKISHAVPLVALLLSSNGCVEDKPVAPARLPVASAVAPEGAAGEEILRKEKDNDYGCGYFYFLWGRHAELEAKYDAALEAYEKALICDPDADFVISKLPALLVQMNRRDEAAARLRDYLRKHPEKIDARMQLANLLIDKGKLQEAAEQYRNAYKLNPQDTEPLLRLSELHLSESKPEQAKVALQNVLATDSRSYPAHLLLARLFIAEEDFSHALEHYQQALALSPSEGLRLEMAEVLLKQKKYDQAVNIYKELLAQDEQNEEARIGLIHVCLLQNKERAAMQEIKRLNKLTGTPEQAELTIVKLYIRWEEYGKAIALLQEILAKHELPEARYLLGALQLQEKNYKDALHTLEQISKKEEEYEDGLILQVRVLKELHQEEQAAKRLEAALTGDNQLSPDVWMLLAGIYRTAEQDKACGKTFVRALAAYPDNEQLLYDYGLFLDETSQKKQALAVIKKLLGLNPDHAGALNYIGYTWAESKTNLNKAFLYLTRAKELKPENAYIYDSLGWVYYQMGSLSDAMRTLKQAVAMAPDDAAIHEHLAAAQRAGGERDAADMTWRRALDLYSKQAAAAENTRMREQAEKGCKRVEEKLTRLQQEKEKQ